MRIRNNLNCVVYVNIYNRADIDLEDPNNYNFSGIMMPPGAVVSADITMDDVIYASNAAKTNANYYIMYSSQHTVADTVDLWDNNSDIVRCQQYGKSGDVSCKDSINILLKQRLHDLPMLRVYNNLTYFIFSFIFAFAIVLALLAGIILI